MKKTPGQRHTQKYDSFLPIHLQISFALAFQIHFHFGFPLLWPFPIEILWFNSAAVSLSPPFWHFCAPTVHTRQRRTRCRTSFVCLRQFTKTTRMAATTNLYRSQSPPVCLVQLTVTSGPLRTKMIWPNGWAERLYPGSHDLHKDHHLVPHHLRVLCGVQCGRYVFLFHWQVYSVGMTSRRSGV